MEAIEFVWNREEGVSVVQGGEDASLYVGLSSRISLHVTECQVWSGSTVGMIGAWKEVCSVLTATSIVIVLVIVITVVIVKVVSIIVVVVAVVAVVILVAAVTPPYCWLVTMVVFVVVVVVVLVMVSGACGSGCIVTVTAVVIIVTSIIVSIIMVSVHTTQLVSRWTHWHVVVMAAQESLSEQSTAIIVGWVTHITHVTIHHHWLVVTPMTASDGYQREQEGAKCAQSTGSEEAESGRKYVENAHECGEVWESMGATEE
ncbi:hypothetical protein EDB89DRAFT_1905042 [Lactarius sanguifluus]|nr:hypothetical protein EDB89DRAFT_1905042 [Lactarius sanguifluus]